MENIMKIDYAELLIAIKTGRSQNKIISEFVVVINKNKLRQKLLEELHVGLSKLQDKDIKKFVDSL